MGTTIVLTTIVGDYAYVANVGDSRLYLINDERIIQITKDHSLVEEMVRMGEISEEDARNHPDKKCDYTGAWCNKRCSSRLL